jgi:4'-phosphopantetheinyl transferase
MVVLRLGSSLAVLIAGVAAARDAHDRIATEALRDATGRKDILVTRRPSGRPRLLPPYPELGVSLSYRDGLLLTAFNPEGSVGADLELRDTSTNLDPARLAADHFTAKEASSVAGLKGIAAEDLFLRLWVAKEAVLKLTGRGVYDGLLAPDLGRHLDALSRDNTPIALDTHERHPRLELAVSHLEREGFPAVYVGLARAI